MANFSEEMARKLATLERQVELLLTAGDGSDRYKESNTSTPPTDAELDALLGTPGVAPTVDGFSATVYDTVGGDTYICRVSNGTWITWIGVLAV